jgi:hypothetical protein
VQLVPPLVDGLLAAPSHCCGLGHEQRPGLVLGMRGETWAGIDRALRRVLRGLPGGSSLAKLLAQQRKARHLHQLPPFSPRRMSWPGPTRKSGRIPGSGGETWSAVNDALHSGARGLPGGSSLARLLAAWRGVRNRKGLPALTEAQVLAWADDHHGRPGC